MALYCSACRSANVTTGLGDNVSCLDCAVIAPHANVGQPSPAGETPEPAEAPEADTEEDGDDDAS